jgi:hypothetical protein
MIGIRERLVVSLKVRDIDSGVGEQPGRKPV